MLCQLLRRFVLVFFDAILIYIASLSEHLQHIKAIFDVLCDNQLFVKHSKCILGPLSVAYLSHIVSGDDVAMDGDKVEVVASWPTPCSTRGLHGFLGLAGYYRKFI